MGKASHFTAKNRRQTDINLLIINNGLSPKAAANAVNAKYRFYRDMMNADRMNSLRQEQARKKLSKMAEDNRKAARIEGRAIQSESGNGR